VISFKNGDKYQGTFMKGAFYGEGKYQYKDGGYYAGEYRCGALASHLAPSLFLSFLSLTSGI